MISHPQPIITKLILEKRYLTEKESTIQIAKNLGCSHITVSRYLQKFGISRRNRSEAIHLARKSKFIITDITKDYIDGLLLGDGYLSKAGKYSAHYRHACSIKSEIWIEKIKSDFENFGISSTTTKYVVPFRKIKGKTIPPSKAIMLYTKCYEEFKIFRERWYPNGRKIVPRDISIMPSLLANWYMGDGSYSIKPPNICLATHRFSKEDILWLIQKIYEKLSIKSYIRPVKDANQFFIQITKKADIQKFLEYVKPYKTPCFDYKWR